MVKAELPAAHPQHVDHPNLDGAGGADRENHSNRGPDHAAAMGNRQNRGRHNAAAPEQGPDNGADDRQEPANAAPDRHGPDNIADNGENPDNDDENVEVAEIAIDEQHRRNGADGQRLAVNGGNDDQPEEYGAVGGQPRGNQASGGHPRGNGRSNRRGQGGGRGEDWWNGQRRSNGRSGGGGGGRAGDRAAAQERRAGRQRMPMPPMMQYVPPPYGYPLQPQQWGYHPPLGFPDQGNMPMDRMPPHHRRGNGRIWHDEARRAPSRQEAQPQELPEPMAGAVVPYVSRDGYFNAGLNVQSVHVNVNVENRHPPGNMAQYVSIPGNGMPNVYQHVNMMNDGAVPYVMGGYGMNMFPGGYQPMNVVHAGYPGGLWVPGGQQGQFMDQQEQGMFQGGYMPGNGVWYPPVNMAPNWQPLEYMANNWQQPRNMDPNWQPPEDVEHNWHQQDEDQDEQAQVHEAPDDNVAPEENGQDEMVRVGPIPQNMEVVLRPMARAELDERRPRIWLAGWYQPPGARVPVPIGGPPGQPQNAPQEGGRPFVWLNGWREDEDADPEERDPEDEDPVIQPAEEGDPEQQAPDQQPVVEGDHEAHEEVDGDAEDERRADVEELQQEAENPEIDEAAVRFLEEDEDREQELMEQNNGFVNIRAQVMVARLAAAQDAFHAQNHRPEPPQPRLDRPDLRAEGREFAPPIIRCKSKTGSCDCGICLLILGLPTELYLHIFSYLQLPEMIAAKIAFKGYSHLQKALTYAWRSCQTLDVSALEEVKPMPPVCLDEVVADMPNLLAIRCKTNRKRLRNTIRPSIIYTHCPGLQEIDLCVVKFHETSMSELVQRCPHLVKVRMPPQYTDEDMSTLLSGLPNLTSLESGSDGEEGQRFSQLPATLMKLSLTRCTSIRSWNLSQVARCTQLRELLLYTRVEEAQLACRHREQFHPYDVVVPVNLEMEMESHLTLEDWTTIMTSCPHLERLAVAGGFSLTPEHLDQMSSRRTPQLRDLDLSRIVGMNYTGLNIYYIVDALASFPRLDRLTLQSLQGLKLIHRAVPREFAFTLTYLDVSGSRLCDEFMNELPDIMPFLKSLIMRECLGISCGKVFANMRRFLMLEELDIRGTSSATEWCLKELQRCRRLSTLWLRPGPQQCVYLSVEDCYDSKFRRKFLKAATFIDALTMLHLDLRRSGLSLATACIDVGVVLRDMPQKREFTIGLHADYLEHMEKPPPHLAPRLQLFSEPDRYPGYASDSSDSLSGSREQLYDGELEPDPVQPYLDVEQGWFDDA